MVGYVFVSVEIVLMRCYVIILVEFVMMVVYLVGWVINVIRVSFIFIESSVFCCVLEFVLFNFGCLFCYFFLI